MLNYWPYLSALAFGTLGLVCVGFWVIFVVEWAQSIRDWWRDRR